MKTRFRRKAQKPLMTSCGVRCVRTRGMTLELVRLHEDGERKRGEGGQDEIINCLFVHDITKPIVEDKGFGEKRKLGSSLHFFPYCSLLCV
jgi:hypothetical protein